MPTRGWFLERSRSLGSKVKLRNLGYGQIFVEFFISKAMGPIVVKVYRCLKAHNRSHPRGSKGSKVKVTRGQGQISVSQRPLGGYQSKLGDL